jgi:hypothetical protein
MHAGDDGSPPLRDSGPLGGEHTIATTLKDIDIAGLIALTRELVLPCDCERGKPEEECRAAALDRSWLIEDVLDDEQRAAWEQMQGRRYAA